MAQGRELAVKKRVTQILQAALMHLFSINVNAMRTVGNPTSWTRPLQVAVIALALAQILYSVSYPYWSASAWNWWDNMFYPGSPHAHWWGWPLPAPGSLHDFLLELLDTYGGTLLTVAIAMAVIVATIKRWSWALVVGVPRDRCPARPVRFRAHVQLARSAIHIVPAPALGTGGDAGRRVRRGVRACVTRALVVCDRRVGDPRAVGHAEGRVTVQKLAGSPRATG